MLLVGDSVAMVVHGHDTTLPVTLDEMLSHCKAVARGARRTFLVGDMPFGSGVQGWRGGQEALLLEGLRVLGPLRAQPGAAACPCWEPS